MAYLKNNKFLEIREAAKNNNEKAAQIIQGLRKNFPQEEIDRMVDEYYAIPTQNDIELVEPEIEQVEEATPAPQPVVEEETIAPVEEIPAIPDLTEALDGELDGIISETEVEDISFKDFLGNKRSDSLKARKNADYFKAFDQGGREKYLTDKTESYRNKFGNRLADIDRHYNDTNKKYTFLKNGSVKCDLLNSEVCYFDNCFVLFSDSVTYENESGTKFELQTQKGGKGFYFTEGSYAEISYLVDDKEGMRFFDSEGNQLMINRGKSYIGIIKSSMYETIKNSLL